MIDTDLQMEAYMRRLDGLSYADVAERWGVSKGTVHDIHAGKGASRHMLNQIRKRIGWGRVPVSSSPSMRRRQALQAELKELGLTIDEAMVIAIRATRTMRSLGYGGEG